MPRAKKSQGPAPAGHNSDGKFTDDEQAALATHFALRVIEDERIVAQKKADLDAARAKVNGHFKMIAKELGVTRKDFEANVITVLGMTEAEYKHAEAKRARLHRLAGIKPGEQLDLVEAIADTVDEANLAEADGYRAGRRADDPTPPATLSTLFHNDWLRGWHAGQEFNGLQLAKAAEVLARPKPGEMAAVPEEAEEGDDQSDIEDEVKRLEEAGWAQPTANEAEFVEADNGRTVRAA